MTHEIKGAHVFSVGNWNNIPFTASDLDEIVRAFNELGSGGRVPLKAGHNDAQSITDGQPALGWVSRIWRQGEKLLADFSGLPTQVFEAIKAGLYKFCSIELLRGAERNGQVYNAVLDAIALLGADPPAVTNLEDLQRLAHSRNLKFAALQVFSRALDTEVESDLVPDNALVEQYTRDIADLRTENKRLKFERDAARQKLKANEATLATTKAQAHSERLHAHMETLVRAGKLTPATRDQLIKAKKLDHPMEAAKFSMDDLQLFTRAQAIPARNRFIARTHVEGTSHALGDTDGERATLVEAKVKAGMDRFSAGMAVARERPDLVQEMVDDYNDSRRL